MQFTFKKINKKIFNEIIILYFNGFSFVFEFVVFVWPREIGGADVSSHKSEIYFCFAKLCYLHVILKADSTF
jgi:hypothetical protein